MATVQLERLTKTYRADRGEVTAVRQVDLNIHDKEFVVLVGPSGCGKSTTLRMIAGLEEVTSGTVRIGGDVVNNVAPKNRDIAMVFQNYALYPHMTVYKNMSFGLKMRRVPRDEIDRKVVETARMLGIERLLKRKPKALSGGERQRVAVGRAIVRNPRAFLFDEPLSNLDARMRVSMRAELKKLHRQLQTTTIYVTHDQEEAMTLGDRIAVMQDGVVKQYAPPLEVYHQPANRFVAGFVGTPPMNFLPGRLVTDGGARYVDVGFGRLKLPPQLADLGGTDYVLGVRPENLSLAPGSGDGSGPADEGLRMTCRLIEPLGADLDVYLENASGAQMIARVPADVEVQENHEVYVFVERGRLHLFEAGEAGRNVGLNGRGTADRAC